MYELIVNLVLCKNFIVPCDERLLMH